MYRKKETIKKKEGNLDRRTNFLSVKSKTQKSYRSARVGQTMYPNTKMSQVGLYRAHVRRMPIFLFN